MVHRWRWVSVCLLAGVLLAASVAGQLARPRDSQRHEADTRSLIGAIRQNDAGAVIRLLDAGANPNAIAGGSGESVLFMAVDSNASLAIVRLLIAHGADVNIQENGFHQTALMRVANDPTADGRTDVVRALLQAHYNLELRDLGGDTALRIAEKSGNTGIAALLRSAGAKEHSLFPLLRTYKTVYKITDLGLGRANALNDQGEVVGVVSEGNTDNNGQLLGQAFVWSHGRSQVLNAFNGPSSIAESVNDQGQVVGEADFSKSSDASRYTRHAFLWQNGTMQDIHPSNDGSEKDVSFSSDAVSINHDGQVAEDVNGYLFLWKNGTWNGSPEVLSSTSSRWDTAFPVAMNDYGQIVLHLQGSGTEHAGLWEDGKLRELSPPEVRPEVIEGRKVNLIENYHADGINDSGEIVGHTDFFDPVVWSHGKPSFLPHLYHFGEMDPQMRPISVNNHGLIVGTVSDELDADHPEQHAVLWQGGKVVDLNALIPVGSGWTLEEARGINEAGQIVGRGTYQGKEHAFLLTPLASAAGKS